MTNFDPRVQELSVDVAVLKTRLEEAHRALEKQATEYERRLEELNNAHSRAERVLHTYMPRELADKNWAQLHEWQTRLEVEIKDLVTREELDKALSGVDGKLSLLTEYRQNIMGRFGALSDAWGWLVGFAGVVIAFLTYWFKT